MNEGMQAASAHGLETIWSAARFANPDFDACRSVTFQAGANFRAAAARWRDEIFLPRLLPAFRETLERTRLGQARELIAIDTGLSEGLSPSAREHSTEAGRQLAARLTPLRGDRLQNRFCEWVRTGRTPGHLPILFAMRCAIFSMPDRTAVGAYLFQEICAGDRSAGICETSDFVRDCIDRVAFARHELRAA